MGVDGGGDTLPESSPTRIGRVRRGRAVLLGVGLDDAGEHFRATTGEGYRLLGGSEKTHEAMLDQTRLLLAEIRRRGYRLDNLTRAEADEISALVESYTPGPDGGYDKS